MATVDSSGTAAPIRPSIPSGKRKSRLVANPPLHPHRYPGTWYVERPHPIIKSASMGVAVDGFKSYASARSWADNMGYSHLSVGYSPTKQERLRWADLPECVDITYVMLEAKIDRPNECKEWRELWLLKADAQARVASLTSSGAVAQLKGRCIWDYDHDFASLKLRQEFIAQINGPTHMLDTGEIWRSEDLQHRKWDLTDSTSDSRIYAWQVSIPGGDRGSEIHPETCLEVIESFDDRNDARAFGLGLVASHPEIHCFQVSQDWVGSKLQ